MDPINYSAQQVDPNAAIMGGLKLGVTLDQIQQQRQQQQLQRQAQLQQQLDLQRLASNPDATHADYAAVMTKYPGLAEHLGKAYKVLDDGQRQNAVNFGTRVYSAMLSGNTDLAAQMFEQRAKADPAEAQHLTTMAQLTRQSPAAAKQVAAMYVAGLMGPDKFATSFSTLGTERRAEEKQPADVLKANADAATAVSTAGIKGVEAANAPTATALGNEAKRQEILSAEAQRTVANFNAQIAAANSETQRGQLVLERDKFIADQKNKAGDVTNAAQDQFDNITQSLELVKGLRAELSSSKGSIGTALAAQIPGVKTGPAIGTTMGKLLALVPGTDAKDYRARLDTLKSQQFLTQAKQMKGMGALSDAEGARIERAVGSLDPDQSPEAFANALGVIESTLAKGHAKLIAMGKLPKDGGAFVLKHPVYGNVGDGDIQRLMAQNPGTSREQVIQFLRSTGGQ